jgi:hypothetical protein
MKMHLTVAAIAVTGVLLSCQKTENGKNSTNDVTIASIQQNAPPASPPESGGVVYEQEKPEEDKQQPNAEHQKTPPPVSADWDKQIIKNAELEIKVRSLRTVSANIPEAIRSSGGYIASASETQLSGRLKSEMMIRVPREKFEELLNRLSRYADSIAQKRIASEDVTDEYIDTKARIQVKEKTRDQYFEFLKRAKNIDEVLKVQNEITGLQEDIEAATGRINYIRHQAALSSIHLICFEELPVTTIPEPLNGFSVQLWNAVKGGWVMIQSFLVILAGIWPLWLAGTGIWLAVRKRKIRSGVRAR